MGITESFKADGFAEKINLGVGAYRDDKGKPYVLPSVRTAELKVVDSKLDKEYAGITGVPSFTKASALLAYGPDSAPVREDRIVITQSISGTGALRIGGEFLARFFPNGKKIFIPSPSWANHKAVFTDSGLEVHNYRYYNKDTIGLDLEGMLADIKAAPEGSIVLLHACAHNPTGIDPSEEQWKEISKVVKEKKHYPFFDMAYQGFASGDTNKDAFAVRYFVSEGHQICLAQSFAKNMVSRLSRMWVHPTDMSPGALRRARWSLLNSLRFGRREKKSRFAAQDPGTTIILKSPNPRCQNCLRDFERCRIEQAMAWRSQRNGRPHHHHACTPQEEP